MKKCLKEHTQEKQTRRGKCKQKRPWQGVDRVQIVVLSNEGCSDDSKTYGSRVSEHNDKFPNRTEKVRQDAVQQSAASMERSHALLIWAQSRSPVALAPMLLLHPTHLVTDKVDETEKKKREESTERTTKIG